MSYRVYYSCDHTCVGYDSPWTAYDRAKDEFMSKILLFNDMRGLMSKMSETKTNSCDKKRTMRSAEQKKALMNRLRRIEGQVRGIQKMINDDAYCNDVLIQSAAVNAAMNAFDRELIADHIKTCVTKDIRDGNDELTDELIATLKKLMK